ncbi:MAG: hypothetical protein KKE02_21015 [Alphaproteobacteria bacterium]|nr:hypothetical protein [Alphaproteobacteria bacterium]MBU1514483.1 hypothetical protein [Alphaproteobacteria bacterium]MBU2096885.1 hypothetical protein [Alphaproteobacteria bacterium]MBU2153512.1 hypothetical protein [Alphaproteobacteria bacterium]MBU2305983.1 hypothetical protein [Alphaproteobacteria bacterium]
MPRIAIVGSCITRDLWPIRGGGAEALLYVSRTSLPGLLGTPVAHFAPFEDLPGDLHQHEHKALVADIHKTALRGLLAYRPTHIIFDFIDERFDLLTVGGALASNSGEMVRSGYRTQEAFGPARMISRLSEACERMWLEAADEFAAVVRGTPLARATLILHSARWADRQRRPNGRLAPIRNVEIVGGQSAVIADYNALLDRQEAAFAARMPAMTRIDADAFRFADSEHRWGLSPFHYIPEYYDEVRRQLVAVDGLEDAFSDRLAAPSVPAG